MKKILICDDDEGISEVMKVILEEAGYEVSITNNGKGIQKKLRHYKPNMIFLDIWMPGMDGKEATKIIKRDSEFAKIPIIIVSALTGLKEIVKACGADGFLAKPFEMNTLLSIADKYTS